MRENFDHSVGKVILSPKNQQKLCRRPGLCSSGHIHPALALYIKLLKFLQGVIRSQFLRHLPLLDKRIDKEWIGKAGMGQKSDYRQRLVPVRDWMATRFVLALVGY